MVVVSFLGAAPGALMRTVSRFVIGVSSGLGGSVMRTVSVFGAVESVVSLVSEGYSSSMECWVRRFFYLTRRNACQSFAPDFPRDIATRFDPAASAGHFESYG
jgi:hypothetical protein